MRFLSQERLGKAVRGWVSACLLMLLAPAPANANEVAELLSEAETAYSEGHLRIATTRLQQAINLLRDLEHARAKALFPAPFKGWSRDDDNDALDEFRSLGIGSLFVTAQAYRRGDESLRIMLLQKPSTAHPLFGLLLSSLESTVQAGEKVVVGKYSGKLSCPDTTASQCRLLVSVNDDYLLYADGEKMKREDILAYVRAMPLERIEGFR